MAVKSRFMKSNSPKYPFILLLLLFWTLKLPAAAQSASDCSPPILSRLQPHQIKAGETVESIANQFGLLPETLIGLNSVLQKGSVPVGTEILIPPINGVRLEAPANTTWKDLETTYGIRADILFEMNGCQKTPTVVFLPGVNWSTRQNTVDNYTGLKSYPLPAIATVGLTYGWQNSPSQTQIFHSGIDLLAEPGTPILAADAGTVVYAGKEDNYGNFVVIDHGGGRQTRYAHLDKIAVSLNQTVQAGVQLGTVGASGKPDLATPHLHFEVRYYTSSGWVAQDPENYLAMARSQ